MQIEYRKEALKYLARMNEPMKSVVAAAIRELAHEPPEGDIAKLQGREGYRLRVNNYRVIYRIDGDTIIIRDIAPRGEIYKRKAK
ncbi:hypothetical protein AGMMS50229_17050 [Campylobacterota bacterium]|nr:hypothetical protein AGMMS50229_17050 [Campylobacterota bacterium]